jgi:hypothetical protein
MRFWRNEGRGPPDGNELRQLVHGQLAKWVFPGGTRKGARAEHRSPLPLRAEFLRIRLRAAAGAQHERESGRAGERESGRAGERCAVQAALTPSENHTFHFFQQPRHHRSPPCCDRPSDGTRRLDVSALRAKSPLRGDGAEQSSAVGRRTSSIPNQRTPASWEPSGHHHTGLTAVVKHFFRQKITIGSHFPRRLFPAVLWPASRLRAGSNAHLLF